jgi:hypothetical protein
MEPNPNYSPNECCPYCHVEVDDSDFEQFITERDLEYQGQRITRWMECEECGRKWLEIYSLAEIVLQPEEPDEESREPEAKTSEKVEWQKYGF